MSSELIERIKLKAAMPFATHEEKQIAEVFAALQAELAEAREAALEDAAQEADKWFPANTASRYPTGGIAAAIRAMKP